MLDDQSLSWSDRHCGRIRGINRAGFIIAGSSGAVSTFRPFESRSKHSDMIRADPAEEVLQREIASIRELLEAEPDSKCGFFRLDVVGCLLRGF